MRLIDASGLRIALVWDGSRKLKGLSQTVTSEEAFCQTRTWTIAASAFAGDRCLLPRRYQSLTKGKDENGRVLALPIVDSEFRVVGLETIETVNLNPRKCGFYRLEDLVLGSALNKPAQNQCP